MRGLDHPNPTVRAKCARELGKRNPTDKGTFQSLLGLTDDPDQTVREAATQAIGGFGEKAVPILTQLLGHKCKYVRRNAVWALGKLGEVSRLAVRPLCHSLKDADPRAAGGAAQALGAIGPAAADAVAALAETMRGTNVVLCRLASKALSQIGLAAIHTLVQHLKHSDPFVRGEAAVALGWMGAAAGTAVPHLTQLLVGRAAAKTPPTKFAPLGGSDAVTPAAIAPPPATGGAEESTLVQVIQALGRIGPEAATAEPHLLSLLTDHREAVRLAASESLQAIRGE